MLRYLNIPIALFKKNISGEQAPCTIGMMQPLSFSQKMKPQPPCLNINVRTSSRVTYANHYAGNVITNTFCLQ